MITLPNGNSIGLDMLEIALEDSNSTQRYFLNLVTGEVVFLSEEINASNDYVTIERIPSHQAYWWMIELVDEVVATADQDAASK